MSIAAAVTCAVTCHLSIQGGSRVWTAGTSVWLIGLQCPFRLSIFAEHFRFLICSFWMWQAFLCRKTAVRSSKDYTLCVSHWWEVRYSVILHCITVFIRKSQTWIVFSLAAYWSLLGSIATLVNTAMARTNTTIRLSVAIHWNGYDVYRWLLVESDALVIWAMAEYIVLISTGAFCLEQSVCIPFLIEAWHSCVLENKIK